MDNLVVNSNIVYNRMGKLLLFIEFWVTLTKILDILKLALNNFGYIFGIPACSKFCLYFLNVLYIGLEPKHALQMLINSLDVLFLLVYIIFLLLLEFVLQIFPSYLQNIGILFIVLHHNLHSFGSIERLKQIIQLQSVKIRESAQIATQKFDSLEWREFFLERHVDLGYREYLFVVLHQGFVLGTVGNVVDADTRILVFYVFARYVHQRCRFVLFEFIGVDFETGLSTEMGRVFVGLFVSV